MQKVTSSWFFLSTLNYDARSTTHQIHKRFLLLHPSLYMLDVGREGRRFKKARTTVIGGETVGLMLVLNDDKLLGEIMKRATPRKSYCSTVHFLQNHFKSLTNASIYNFT